jgi:hypothetical protein
MKEDRILPMTRIPKPSLLIFSLVLFSILVGGCASQAERLWLKAPDWSRAQLIGNTRIGDPIAIAIYSPGRAALLMFEASESGSILRLDALEDDGRTRWTHRYDQIPLSNPAEPELIWDGSAFHMFWRMKGGLYHLAADSEGNLLAPPVLLSGGQVVDTYDVSINPEGQIAALLGSPIELPQVVGIEDIASSSQTTMLDRYGINPMLQFDSQGDLHAAWAHAPTSGSDPVYYYAKYDGGKLTEGKARLIAEPIFAGTSSTEGPYLGLDGENVYVFWSVVYFSGELAGTAASEYVFFPIGRPGSVSPQHTLAVPYEYDLNYVSPASTTVLAGDRVLLGAGFTGGAGYITQLNPNPNLNDELVLTMTTRQGYLMRKVQSQVNAVFLRDGISEAYQQLSFTQGYSSQPVIVSDSQGYLYFAWLEKGSLAGWAVYFASTHPGIVDGYKAITQDDWGRLSADTLFGMVSGTVLVPFALAWTLPTLLALMVISRLRGQKESLADPGGVIAIAIGVALLWLVKVAILPGIRSYVPFSAWLPFIPEGLSTALIFGVPLLITAFSLIAASRFMSGDEQSPIFKFMIVYIITDGILTMSIYGVLVFAAF